MIKRMIILGCILTVVCVIIFVFRPISFNNDFFYSDSITISYLIDNKLENNTVIPNINSTTFKNGSIEFQELEQIFKKYTYHYCIHTWTGKASSENTTYAFILTSGDKSMIVTNAPHIIIGNKVYRIGYLGEMEIHKLVGELKNLLAD